MAINYKKVYNKYFLMAAFLVVIYLAYLIIKPYLVSIFMSILVAYLLYPIYEWLKRIIQSRSVRAVIMVIVVLSCVVVPALFVINTFSEEAETILRTFNAEDVLKGVEDILKLIPSKPLYTYIDKAIDMSSFYLLTKAKELLVELPKMVVAFFVFIFSLYYFFTHGREVFYFIIPYLPLTNLQRHGFIIEIKQMSHAVVYGVLFGSLLQGLISAVSFYIFNVKAPVLFGFLTAIVSALPGIGPAVVWLPTSIMKLISGEYGNAIGIFLVGLILISYIEVFLRPKLIGAKSGVHPAIILIGILGGFQVFGFAGLLMGPLVLSILSVFFKIYSIRGDVNEIKSEED